MLENIADEIFREAGVDKAQYPDLFQQCVEILNNKMAMLSAMMGMSGKRVELFEAQRKSLIQDLVDMKNNKVSS